MLLGMVDPTQYSSNNKSSVNDSDRSDNDNSSTDRSVDKDKLDAILKKKSSKDQQDGSKEGQGTALPTPQSLIGSLASGTTTTTTGTQPTITIGQIADKIVDQVQINTNTLGNQEVTIQFSQNTLPNTSVTLSMNGNQLNINFQAGSVQAASFLSESAIAQLRTEIKNRISATSDREVVISVQHTSESDTLTENAVRRRQDTEEGEVS